MERISRLTSSTSRYAPIVALAIALTGTNAQASVIGQSVRIDEFAKAKWPGTYAGNWRVRTSRGLVVKVAFTSGWNRKARVIQGITPRAVVRGVNRKFSLRRLNRVKRGAMRYLKTTEVKGWVAGTNFVRNRIYFAIPRGHADVRAQLKRRYGRAISLKTISGVPSPTERG